MFQICPLKNVIYFFYILGILSYKTDVHRHPINIGEQAFEAVTQWVEGALKIEKSKLYRFLGLLKAAGHPSPPEAKFNLACRQ